MLVKDHEAVLQASAKFRAWRSAPRDFSDEDILRPCIMAEKHYTQRKSLSCGAWTPKQSVTSFATSLGF